MQQISEEIKKMIAEEVARQLESIKEELAIYLKNYVPNFTIKTTKTRPVLGVKESQNTF